MTALRFGTVLLAVVVLQTELFSELRVLGVMPELLLGLTIAAGWNSDPARGALAGFAAGLAYDLFLATPFGLTALAYTLVGHVAGVLGGGIADTSAAALRRIVSIAGIAAGITLFALLGELLTGADLIDGDIVVVLLVAPLYTALLMPLLHRVAFWAVAPRGALAPPRRRAGVLE